MYIISLYSGGMKENMLIMNASTENAIITSIIEYIFLAVIFSMNEIKIKDIKRFYENGY